MTRQLHCSLILVLCTGASTGFLSKASASPYASNVTKTGIAVSFILNEPADTLKYSINGGALVALDGTTKGTKSFNLGAPTDTFKIVADKTAATGYTIPNGGQILPSAPGSLGIATSTSGMNLISSDANNFSHYNAPRGVGVNNNPNNLNFGTVYISNSVAGTGGGRSLGDGMYAIRADQSDAFGFGDAAQNPIVSPDSAAAFVDSSSSPYRLHVAASGDVFVSDFADVNSNVYTLPANLSSAQMLFTGRDGTSGAGPDGGDGTFLTTDQYHGSSVAVYAEGSLATNNLVVYTLDEDLTSAHVSGNLSDPTTDKYSVWKYDIGGGPLAVNVKPTKIATIPQAASTTFADFDKGPDGKFYLCENVGGTTKMKVTDASGTTLWDSLTASNALGSETDILTNLNDIAISRDQKYLAGMLNYSDVLVLPLINGLPDLANRLVVDSGGDTDNSGRDIAFDAAGNIYYVSSGQGLYRVLAPGGHTTTTLTWNGTSYSFTVGTPGDYNNDNKVDAVDYTIWHDTLGSTSNLAADGNSNGTVDIGDFTVWKNAFGTGSGSGGIGGGGGTVPEPTSMLLMLVGALLPIYSRRAMRRKAT